MARRIDPLFDALSTLTPLEPRASHSQRVRGACHRVLAEHRARHGRSIGRARYADVLSAAGVAMYVIALLTAAVRLLAAA